MSNFVIVEIRTTSKSGIFREFHLRRKGRKAILKNIVCAPVRDDVPIFDSSMAIKSYGLGGDTKNGSWCKHCRKIMIGETNKRKLMRERK